MNWLTELTGLIDWTYEPHLLLVLNWLNWLTVITQFWLQDWLRWPYSDSRWLILTSGVLILKFRVSQNLNLLKPHIIFMYEGKGIKVEGRCFPWAPTPDLIIQPAGTFFLLLDQPVPYLPCPSYYLYCLSSWTLVDISPLILLILADHC